MVSDAVDVVDVATRNHQTAQREQQGRTAQLDGYGFY